MTSTLATNQAVLDALCIDGKHITSLTLTMDNPRELPKVTITRYLSAKPGAEKVTEYFELVGLGAPQPVEPPPLDLAAMADAARARLARFVDTRARQVHSQVEHDFHQARFEFEVSRMTYNFVHALDLESISKSLFGGSMGGPSKGGYCTGFLSPFPLTGLL